MQTFLYRALHDHLVLFPEQPAPEASAAEDGAFRAGCRARLLHHCRLLALSVLAFTLLWWPTDVIVFRGMSQVLPFMNLWRAAVAGLCAAYLLVPQPAFLRRRPLVTFTPLVLGTLGVVGYAVGRMGGPELPHIHLMYVTFCGTVLLPIALWPRVALTLAFALAILTGYFGPFPRYLSSPYLPLVVSFSICVLALSIGFGHLLHVLLRENFLLALKIRGQAADLTDHSARLEERVTARTAELRRLLVHLETAREDERARISRELHDELGQELSALRFALQHAQGRYGQDPLSVGPNLSELEMLLGRTGAAARALVSDLRPRVLDELGLPAAAEWLVRRVEERSGVAIELQMDREDAAVPAGAAATVAFRVLQESLTNIERHAGARSAQVTLRLRAGSLELSVSDDGAGFAQGKGRSPGGGMGLIGMRERALGAGGDLTIDSEPGRGTRVRLRLPLSS